MRRKKTAVLTFPGSLCDRDVVKALAGCLPELVPSQERIRIQDYRAFILPGGFSHGDYLRSGALAAKSPAIKDIQEAAKRGFPVLGICNGFQILCEAGILPGALLPNKGRRFIDKSVRLILKEPSHAWRAPRRCALPIAHGEGRYFIDPEGLKRLQGEGKIWLVYEDCPNGSLHDIAGVKGAAGNVAGLMPHPERAVEDGMGSLDGRAFFEELRHL